tara:strand:+ start:131 stop:1027 length:897 start_codon:yes stop_codon:yes gene_type:complete
MYALLLDLYFWKPELELLGGFREQYTVRMKVPWALQKHLGGQFQASHIDFSTSQAGEDWAEYKFGSEDAPTPSEYSDLFNLAYELEEPYELDPSHPQIEDILKAMELEGIDLGFSIDFPDDNHNNYPNEMFYRNKDFWIYLEEGEDGISLSLDLKQHKGALKDQINALPSIHIYDAVAPLPESSISASRRAELMGLPAVKCRWTEYTPAKCNSNSKGKDVDPITLEEFEKDDMVWQTTKGHCFGPDKGDGLYQPFYYNNSDVFQNPVSRERLPQDCFARARKEDDPDFPGGRNVRQRT